VKTGEEKNNGRAGSNQRDKGSTKITKGKKKNRERKYRRMTEESWRKEEKVANKGKRARPQSRKQRNKERNKGRGTKILKGSWRNKESGQEK
jgi:hypothetical protein